MSLFYDFLCLIYPRLCYACNASLSQHEDVLCAICQFHLPKTNYHLDDDNPLAKNFWGRVPIAHVAALYHFKKGGNVQNLIHQFKYNGKTEIGTYIGESYGKDLLQSDFFKDVEVVIPVPLHKRKKRKRGFNQSEIFAKGLSTAMQIPCDTKTLVRTTASKTQTKKSRFKRWENVKEIFAITDTASLKGKHILLVDDVITTGATIEACVNQLLTISDVKISVAAMACTAG